MLDLKDTNQAAQNNFDNYFNQNGKLIYHLMLKSRKNRNAGHSVSGYVLPAI